MLNKTSDHKGYFHEGPGLTVTPQRLLAFICQHDLGGCEQMARDNGDGTLTVYGEVVHGDSKTVTIESERIPATLQAVRDWLGY